ncbi:hypothetical protein [Arthrobacter sp. OAP107]|uniref:hypothetical protein n=1 Tax=Arthrobacter sp. OAP107 TaxID=3156445 RepID=UPI00339B0767
MNDAMGDSAWDPRSVRDEDIIADAIQLLHDFDNTPPNAMTPLFYQHGFEELSLAVRDLLRILGHRPEGT